MTDFQTRAGRLHKEQKDSNISFAITFIVALVVAVAIIDIFGYVAWTLSGQSPIDNFFLGTITHNLIK